MAGQPGHCPQPRGAHGSGSTGRLWGASGPGGEQLQGERLRSAWGDREKGTTGSGGTVVPNIAEPKGWDAFLKNNNLF